MFNSYHLGIEDPSYVEEYELAMQIVLASQEYLPTDQFNQLFDNKVAKEILLKYIMECAEHLRHYMLLLYAIRVYNTVERAPKKF